VRNTTGSEVGAMSSYDGGEAGSTTSLT
jgi:hypothetical protein